MHFLSIFIAALSLIRQVSCWGGLGHRTVALLARHYLTDELKQFLDDVLAVEENYKTFDDVAIWADDMERGTYGAPVRPETKIWHYIGQYQHIIIDLNSNTLLQTLRTIRRWVEIQDSATSTTQTNATTATKKAVSSQP